MRARDIAVEYPTVTPKTNALEAARLLTKHELPGLIVVDSERRPKAVLSGPRLLGSIVPKYVQEDPNLARVYDEQHADLFCRQLAGKTVADLLDQDKAILPAVDANATVMEIANIMAATRNSLVAVSSDPEGTDAPLLGVITVSQLLDHLLPHD